MTQQERQEYQFFCKNNPVPVFMHDWYLDAVCDQGEWDAALFYNKTGELIAILPYYLSTYQGFRVIKMPRLCPFMGIWIQYPENLRISKKIAKEKKIIQALVAQLPSVNYYFQHYPYQFTNCLPLYWLGYEQRTIYSYRLENIADLESIYANFEGRLRTTIRKAEGIVKVFCKDDLNLFYQINQKSFDRQGLKMPYTLTFLKRLDAALKSRNRRCMYFAKDEQGHVHAALYIVYGDSTAYNLMAGGDPSFRQSGAMQLLLWQAIQDAAQRVPSFDFEGSMLEEIAYSFRAFGGELHPYFELSKARNRLLGLLAYLFKK